MGTLVSLLPWRGGTLPSLDPRLLSPVLASTLGHRASSAILASAPKATPFEIADGHALHLPPEAQDSVDALTAVFVGWIRPAAQHADTSTSYDGPWRAFVTFAIGFDRERELMPTSLELLQAFASYLVAADLTANTIALYFTCIKDHHLRHGLPFILAESEQRAWMRALGCKVSRPTRQDIPTTAAQVRALLVLPVRTAQEYQDILATSLATVIACRPSDLVDIDVCDFLLSFFNDPPGTAAINIRGAKPDVKRKGHHPRLGAAADPRYDLVAWILEWCAHWGYRTSDACTKQTRPHAHCFACGALFRKLDNNVPRPASNPRHSWSTDDFTKAVRQAITRLDSGTDASMYTARSCRAGALSLGASRSIPEYIMSLQSGHRRPQMSNPATQHYILLSPDGPLFELWAAFGL